jgi:hypothetical protein
MGEDLNIKIYDKNETPLDTDVTEIYPLDIGSGWWNKYIETNPDKEWKATGAYLPLSVTFMNIPWYIKVTEIKDEGEDGIGIYFKVNWFYKLWLRIKI